MEESKTRLFQALTILVLVAVVFVVTQVISEIKGYRFIGGGVDATNTISVSGDGEVMSAPDIATISFTVRDVAKTASDAQSNVSSKTKVALDAIKKVGVAEKDIKTQSYSSYPKYEWRQTTSLPCVEMGCPPPSPGKQVIVGYEVSQSVTLTVRNMDLVNSVVEALGQSEVSDMYGPNFAIDNEDILKAQARKQAIDKARSKAEVLARDLGVTLVRIVSFSEGQNYPMYDRAMSMASAPMGKAEGAPTPELPQGEQKITSSVTVTYEIR